MGNSMTITIKWDEKLPHTIHYQFVGHWTWEEYYQTFSEKLAMVNSIQPHAYDVITDMLHGSFIPRGLGIRHAINIYKMASTHMRLAVVVTTSALIQTSLPILFRIQPEMSQRLRLAASVEAARTIIQQHHPGTADTGSGAPRL
jgi:hypothetical protein